MSNAAIDTDVLIVGAGPVGLFLANECARRGLRFRLVEARASQSEHSKALAVMPRTLEIFDMAGIAGPFLEVANRVTWVAVVEPSRTLARMRFTPGESPYPFVVMVPQDVTERVLVENDDHVNVRLDRRGEHLELTARFVVGCDGAHSAVRHLLNLPFEGEAYNASFLLADTETNETLPADEMQLCPSEFGAWQFFP
jgi:2-polyprenyl-6-methoxyphenol hydroxylase-like FAD-dependent oxidoreductase